jgi:hypothetical protein
MDEALVRQLKERVDEELRKRELSFLEFWLEELRKIDSRRHKELAGLQSDLKNLMVRMETRQRTLKSPVR